MAGNLNGKKIVANMRGFQRRGMQYTRCLCMCIIVCERIKGMQLAYGSRLHYTKIWLEDIRKCFLEDSESALWTLAYDDCCTSSACLPHASLCQIRHSASVLFITTKMTCWEIQKLNPIDTVAPIVLRPKVQEYMYMDYDVIKFEFHLRII